MIVVLHALQYQLLISDFRKLCRGYVAKGPIYHKGYLIFGKGFNDAYLGYDKTKGAPRIVIDDKIIELGKSVVSKEKNQKNKVSFLDFLRKDSQDEKYFIDYFKPIAPFPKDEYKQQRKEIYSFIKLQIKHYNNDNSKREKYMWLLSYYKETSHYYKD